MADHGSASHRSYQSRIPNLESRPFYESRPHNDSQPHALQSPAGRM